MMESKYRLGRLKSGNPAAPIEACWAAPRCGAKAKSTGKPCRKAALRGKTRCRLHGGKSTGPKTAEGRKRISEANTKHGYYTKENKEWRKQRRLAIKLRGPLPRRRRGKQGPVHITVVTPETRNG